MKALVIGLGRMGRFHAKVLTDLGYDVSTLDPDPAAGADHLSAGSVGRFGFEAVAIATPIPFLAPTAALWTRRARHLLIEKPMASTVEEARELELALGDHSAVAVGYVERFNPQVRALRERLAGRRVATARFTRYNARPTADVLLDLQSHDIDLARVLGLDLDNAIYNSLADVAKQRREIDVSARDSDQNLVLERADLTAHTTSPLHAQWHALLSGRAGCATPQDAIRVLEEIERRRPLFPLVNS